MVPPGEVLLRWVPAAALSASDVDGSDASWSARSCPCSCFAIRLSCIALRRLTIAESGAMIVSACRTWVGT